jgi:thiamine biosynthesis lipoprotein
VSDSKTSRRDFLRGRAVVEQLQHATGALSLAEPDSSSYLLRFTRRAMACDFEVLLNAGQYPHASDTAIAALDLVDELESQLSVYRDDSELTRLNHSAHERPIKVEPRLFALLETAARIHRETSAAYDIATGALSKIWGFYRRAGNMPTPEDLAAIMPRVGLKHVQIDAEAHTVRFDAPGVELNLGSIGKGYALDRAAESLVAAGVEDFLLHGGNSSVLAQGTVSPGLRPGVSDSKSAESIAATSGWSIGLRHPLDFERRIGEINLQNRALGTSGSGTQFFLHEGHRYGHILDPRTGQPAEGILSTTVAAPTGAEADALATAFYVLGRDASLKYCRTHPHISAVIMSPIAADERRVELSIIGFTDRDIHFEHDESIAIHFIER